MRFDRINDIIPIWAIVWVVGVIVNLVVGLCEICSGGVVRGIMLVLFSNVSSVLAVEEFRDWKAKCGSDGRKNGTC